MSFSTILGRFYLLEGHKLHVGVPPADLTSPDTQKRDFGNHHGVGTSEVYIVARFNDGEP